jgi:hypothetical protein
MAAGRLREMPVERITTVLSNVLYGIMVTNFFNGQPAPADVQAREILDVVFLGVLSEPERRRFLDARRATEAIAAPEPAADTETERRTTGNGISGCEPFGGANGHDATMVDAPVGAVAGGDDDGLSAGSIGAAADGPDRRV